MSNVFIYNKNIILASLFLKKIKAKEHEKNNLGIPYARPYHYLILP